MDDTAGGDKEDALTEMGFYVPKEANGYGDEGEEHGAKVGRVPCPMRGNIIVFNLPRKVVLSPSPDLLLHS